MTGVLLFYMTNTQHLPAQARLCMFAVGCGLECVHASPTNILPIKHMGGQIVYCVALQRILSH